MTFELLKQLLDQSLDVRLPWGAKVVDFIFSQGLVKEIERTSAGLSSTTHNEYTNKGGRIQLELVSHTLQGLLGYLRSQGITYDDYGNVVATSTVQGNTNVPNDLTAEPQLPNRYLIANPTQSRESTQTYDAEGNISKSARVTELSKKSFEYYDATWPASNYQVAESTTIAVLPGYHRFWISPLQFKFSSSATVVSKIQVIGTLTKGSETVDSFDITENVTDLTLDSSGAKTYLWEKGRDKQFKVTSSGPMSFSVKIYFLDANGNTINIEAPEMRGIVQVGRYASVLHNKKVWGHSQ